MFDNENNLQPNETIIEPSYAEASEGMPDVNQTEQMVEPNVNSKVKIEAKTEAKKEDHPNFKMLRAQKEKAERERDELLQLLKQKQSVPEEEEIQLKPDDLVEGKHFNKKVKKLEEQLKQYQQQTELMAIEAQIKAQYPDFDKVVSKDNVDRFREEYPELAATLNASTDLKSKAASAYTMIKKFGIYQEDVYEPDRNRAQANASKPKPLAAVGQGDSPMSRANAFAQGLTDELRKSLLKEMNESRRGY